MASAEQDRAVLVEQIRQAAVHPGTPVTTGEPPKDPPPLVDLRTDAQSSSLWHRLLDGGKS
jgi:hypothetical protein